MHLVDFIIRKCHGARSPERYSIQFLLYLLNNSGAFTMHEDRVIPVSLCP